MTEKNLEKSIAELKRQLDQYSSLSEEQQSELRALVMRLDLLLEENSEGLDTSIIDGFERNIIEYEEDHPVFARIMRDIVNTLNGMGI